VDIDCKAEYRKQKTLFRSKFEALDHIERMNLGESIIVDTGNGLHIYWLFDQPIELNEKNTGIIENLMKSLANMLGGDSTHDVSRVLRMPGTLNVKDKSNPLNCMVISENSHKRYSLDDIQSIISEHPLSKISFRELKSNKLYESLFGLLNKDSYESNSDRDQAIITHLLSKGIKKDEIKLLFKYFPTTGKYLDRFETDPKGADSYLEHSIENAVKYIEKNNKNNPNCTVGQTSKRQLSPSIYIENLENNKLGYYMIVGEEQSDKKRMTNFIIRLNEQIASKRDHKVSSVFSGDILFDDGEVVEFDDFEADFLAVNQELRKYLANKFGVKPQFFTNSQNLVEAIKANNRATKRIEAQEFGFDDNLERYVTSDQIITADGIKNVKTPILYDQFGDKAYLGFKVSNNEITTDEIIFIIKEKLLNFNSPGLMYYLLSTTFLPIVFPFIRKYVSGKPYLMIQGPSGCGKSTLVDIMKSFYGEFQTRITFASTSTSLQVIGHALKDALIVVDDMKLANFQEKDIPKIQTMVQNYSDETARDRSNINLGIKDRRIIRGIMLINGEDVVLTEASTIARGIIIPMKKYSKNPWEIQTLSEYSKYFRKFTAGFIQYLLNKKRNNYDFHTLLRSNQEAMKTLFNEYTNEDDNSDRLINNLAIFKTSWDLLSEVIFDFAEIELHKDMFMNFSKELIIHNYNRIRNKKPEVKFIETLWQMIENKALSFVDVNKKDDTFVSPENVAGYYWKRESGAVKVGIRLHHVYKRINNYLKTEGGLGHSFEAIAAKLAHDGIIIIPSGDINKARVNYGNHYQHRGVEWVGPIPYVDANIPKPQDPLPFDDFESIKEIPIFKEEKEKIIPDAMESISMEIDVEDYIIR
jgi:energy-coupling factor transporter ATP-binding protein EcfA2